MNILVKWYLSSRIYPFISRFYDNRGLFYVTVGNLISAALSATLWLVFASILSPSHYGQISYYIAVGTAGSVLGTFGFNTVNITRIAKSAHIETQGMYYFIFILSVIVSCIIGVLTQSAATGLLSFSLVAFNMSVSVPLGRMEYYKYMKMVIGARALLIFLSFLLYLVFGLEGILIGYAASSLIFSHRYFVHLIKSKWRFDGVTKKDINFSFHAFFMNFAQSSNVFIDKLMIAPLFGFQLLGLYQISSQFLMLLAIIPSSLFFYLLPKEAAGSSKLGISVYAFAFSIFFSIVLFFSSDLILQNLFPRYVGAGELVKIVAFGGIPLTIIAATNSRLLGLERSFFVFIGAMVFLVTLFSSLLFFKTLLGENGMAIALVVSLSAQALFLTVGERLNRSPSP
jgi:O-antigen/teichoic acid export membrane protein